MPVVRFMDADAFLLKASEEPIVSDHEWPHKAMHEYLPDMFIGASEYFKRTENIAGIKVALVDPFEVSTKLLTLSGYAFPSTDA